MKSMDDLKGVIRYVIKIGVFISSFFFTLSIAAFIMNVPSAKILALYGLAVLFSVPIIRVLVTLRHFIIRKNIIFITLSIWVLIAMLLGVLVKS